MRITGSIRKSRNTLRITAHLVDTASGCYLFQQPLNAPIFSGGMLERAFIDRHASLHRVAWRILHDNQDAEDCVQDTFLRAVRFCDTWRGKQPDDLAARDLRPLRARNAAQAARGGASGFFGGPQGKFLMLISKSALILCREYPRNPRQSVARECLRSCCKKASTDKTA
jgi:hypothetical protein